MTLAAANLRPYASLALLRARGGRPSIRDLIAECERALPFADDPHLNPLAAPQFPRRPELDLGVLLYEERRSPPWLTQSDEIRDLVNHLLVVARRDRLVALYMSDARRRAAVVRWLESEVGGRGWRLEAIDSGLLNAAFVRGPARTLWLSGIHVQVTSRADSKVLSGMDLRDALDPLGDQSYYFTAARSTILELRLPVGVSPRGSRVWVGASRDWDHFCGTVEQVLGTLGGTSSPIRGPLPVVAVPCDQVPDLADAFDLHLIPPELLSEDPWEDPEERERLERWALHSCFGIVEGGGHEIEVEVELEGRPLAFARLTIDASDPQHVTWETSVQRHPRALAAAAEALAAGASVDGEIRTAAAARVQTDLDELARVLRRRRWLRIWFESGHTLSDGVVFEVRHRDLPFVGYTWADFHDYQVKTEKFWSKKFPEEEAIDLIGTRGSLFCWLRNHWPPAEIGELWTDGAPRGWLACDDGAMEIADFIHLDNGAEPPILSLVHVKGAKSDKPGRGISVSAYEVVIGQSVKNLRFLDRLHLAEGIRAGLETKIGQLVWHDGAPATREGMIEALARIGSSYRRRVIVLQPQVTEKKVHEVRQAAADGGNHKGDAARLRQLDTLLLAAEATAHGLGAELVVVGDGTGATAATA